MGAMLAETHCSEIAFSSKKVENKLARLKSLLKEPGSVVTELRALGYRYVTLDLADYRPGSMNLRGMP